MFMFMYGWGFWSGFVFGFGLLLACLVQFDIIEFQFWNYIWFFAFFGSTSLMRLQKTCLSWNLNSRKIRC